MNKWIKIGTVLIIVGITGAVLGYKFIYNKPHPDFEKIEPSFMVEAHDLFSEFINSRSESEQKYNGTVVQISGMIDGIEESDSLVIAVFAFQDGMFGDEGIRCTMLPKFNHHESLKPGVNVQIKGFVAGYNETDVILEKCSLIK
ncbi:MAG: hypothetical protein R2764_11665 [Bacteroidales bacterium]